MRALARAPTRSSPRAAANALPPRRASAPLRSAPVPFTPRRTTITAAAATGKGKLISATEIPAFIPRADLIDQLLRWAVAAEEDGRAMYGAPLRVTPVKNEAGEAWGFTVDMLRDGNPTASLAVGFDDTDTVKHEWVGRGVDGFPVMTGSETAVKGKMFEIWSTGTTPLDEDTRTVVRNFCTLMVGAVNKYYAFGSCFSDDST